MLQRAVRRAVERPEEIARLADVEDQLLSFEDMMRLGQYGKNKLRDLIRRRKIPAFKDGGNEWKISRKGWRRAIAKMEAKG